MIIAFKIFLRGSKNIEKIEVVISIKQKQTNLLVRYY